MNTTSLAPAPAAGAIEATLIQGDLSKLSAEQRLSYYTSVCTSLGLNPLTKPLAYLKLDGKLVLYALKDATEQLRKLHGVSIAAVTNQRFDDVFVVTATAADRTGRTDAATGAVSLAGLRGEALANALMKAETKAKRRVTLSICGLGLLDETEVETIPDAQPVALDAAPSAPEGFEAWWEVWLGTVEQGIAALQTSWQAARPEFRAWAQAHHRAEVQDAGARARQAAA